MKRLVYGLTGLVSTLALLLLIQAPTVVAQEVLTATTDYTTTLFSGPGNISCYSSIVGLPAGETLTLIGRAPGVCAPYPGHYYYYVRRSDGTEGWVLDFALVLPPGAENLPLIDPSPTNTPTPSLIATTKYATALFSGPGNITCYNNILPLGKGAALTLIGRAPGVCAPYPGQYYYYVRSSGGVEGWAPGVVLNLPAGAENLPLMNPSPTNTPVGTPAGLTATTLYTTALFSGPGNITCYSNVTGVAGNETLTLLGRAPQVCGPNGNAYFYYVRRANGTEGWAPGVVLNLPAGVENLPLMTPPATNTPTATPTLLPSATSTSIPPTETPTSVPPTEAPTSIPPTETWTPEPPTETPTE